MTLNPLPGNNPFTSRRYCCVSGEREVYRKGEGWLSVSESSRGGVQGGLRWGEQGWGRGEVVCQTGKAEENPTYLCVCLCCMCVMQVCISVLKS